MLGLKWNDDETIWHLNTTMYSDTLFLFRVSWVLVSSSTMLSAVAVISEYSWLHRVNCCCTANSLHIIKVCLSALLNKIKLLNGFMWLAWDGTALLRLLNYVI